MPIFPQKLLKPPNENELEISIFGPGYGESIVLYIPQIGWGIIDSCVLQDKKRTVVLPLEYLLSLLKPQFPKLAFVILTHPHEDHYKGIDQVLQKYPGGTERVCWYEGNGVRELKTYIVQQKVGWRQVLPGLVEIFNALNEAVKSGAQQRRLSEMTEVFEQKNIKIEGYGTTDIRMMALSPSAASTQKYVEKLFEAFPQPGAPVLPIKDEAHNLISVALLLKLGDLQIVLGSDVENGLDDYTGWKGIVFNRDCPDLWANLVKVAHHGSENGFNSFAWEKHCSKKKPLAVITPFCKGNVILPKEKDVEKLKEFSEKVGLTSSVKFIEKLNKYYPRDVVRGIVNKTRSLRIIEPSDKIGFIRVRFLLDGTIIECLTESPASWL